MPEDSLPRRLSFLFLCTLAAVNLSLIVYIMAAPKNRGMTIGQLVSIPASVQTVPDRTFHDIGGAANSSIHAVTHTTEAVLSGVIDFPGHVLHTGAHILNIYTFIRPADYTNLPKITPLAGVKTIAAATPAPTAATPAKQVATPAPNPISYQSGSVTTPSSSISLDSVDMYAWGNCTRWAALRRAQVGDPIPGNWGNAATWASRATADGYAVDHHPTPGSIMQTADSAGGLGHVAFVESVDSDGTWHISEMNVLGLNVVDHRTMPLSAAADYHFIHDKS